MKKDPRIQKHLNKFLKQTRGKCPVIVNCNPSVPALECIIKHRLASGVDYRPYYDGQEIGDWYLNAARKWKGTPGPGGVKSQRFPDWEEVKPPGRPIPTDAPVIYRGGLTEEAIELIKEAKLFFYVLLNWGSMGEKIDKDKTKYIDMFGERFIPGLVWEPSSIHGHVKEVLAEKKNIDRETAYKIARDYIRKIFNDSFQYGLTGGSIEFLQGAGITKQKRWDHELANGNFQVQTAFLRGMSQQYDIPFIAYVAPMGKTPDKFWGTRADPETPYGKVFNITYFAGGKPEHLLERQWFYAWFSGPAAVVLEAAYFYLFKKGPDKNTFEPGCMAPAVKKLNHLAYESNFERGSPYRPACILLDERHGWSLPSPPDGMILGRKIWGVLDYAQQDIMVDNIFGALYPGYEYAGSVGHKYGDLTVTPYGDSFDVLMSNAASKALGKYPVVFLTGKPGLTENFKNRLEKYVSAGGNLVLCIDQVDFQWQDFLGVKFSPRNSRSHIGLGTLRVSDYSEWLDPSLGWKEDRYHYTRIETRKAEVLAVTEQNDPLVVCHKYGQGKIYLVTAHFMQEVSTLKRPNGLLEVSRFLIGYVLTPYQKLKIRGPEIHYMVNVTSDGLSVMLINNKPEVWNGWISFPEMGNAEVREYITGEQVHAYSAGNDLSVRLYIAAYGIKLLVITQVHGSRVH